MTAPVTYEEAYVFFRSEGYSERDAAFLADRSVSYAEYRLKRYEISHIMSGKSELKRSFEER